MAGIIGISTPGRRDLVEGLLAKIAHRGSAGRKIVETSSATLGAVWPPAQAGPVPDGLADLAVWDGAPPPRPEPETLQVQPLPGAVITGAPDGLFAARDPFGVRPLYYAVLPGGQHAFASEVKALAGLGARIEEFPPGTYFKNGRFSPYFTWPEDDIDPGDARSISSHLRQLLEQAVCRRLDGEVMGSWLSGGLDSSAIAALARLHVRKLYTFAAGLPGSPDLEFARQAAEHLKTEHQELLLTAELLVESLPEVIYALESFDALLVRSTVCNYLVSRQAAGYVGAVFSGEGADELFAGYTYLEALPPDDLPAELLGLVRSLHYTALQRVDRSAAAHGLAALVPCLDPDVVRYALRIPARMKLFRNGQVIAKWVLRLAVRDLLPDSILWRPKAKFWEGAGVGDLLAGYAGAQVSDQDFARERRLANGWELNTKEELLYYRIFRQHFGDLDNLDWMGRTQGAPRA